MDTMTVLLCLLIESILYFWLLFLAIDMFEVNDMMVGLASDRNLFEEWLTSFGGERTVAMTSAFFESFVIYCQQVLSMSWCRSLSLRVISVF